MRDMVASFRNFLSPKTKFEWSDDLDRVFNESKKLIVDANKEGVRIFAPTSLRL